MKPIDTLLLFVGKPALNTDVLGQNIANAITSLGYPVENIGAADNAILGFRIGRIFVEITAHAGPLSANSFRDALETPVSRPASGALSEIIVRHTDHIRVNLDAHGEEPTHDRVEQLNIAHAITSAIVAHAPPAAVHWCQSNQLLSGAQYACLASEITPWVLFAHARIHPTTNDAHDERRYRLAMDDVSNFINRPIVFAETSRPLDETHAAALSFLRHYVETGSPIPDGQCFGPKGTTGYRVRHLRTCPEYEKGYYEISAVDDIAEMAPDVTARPSGAKIFTDTLPLAPAAVPQRASRWAIDSNRTQSLAVSYLMLVIMPPLGAILLGANLIFGTNAWRTGFWAAAVVVITLSLGIYSFLGVDPETTAILMPTDTIQTLEIKN